MGYIVQLDGKEVWEPSSRVARYFLDNVASLEQLLETESGIASTMGDEIEIDSVRLNAFVEKAVLEFQTTQNSPLIAMMEGIIGVLIALNAKVNDYPPTLNKRTNHLVSRSNKIFNPLEDYLK